MSRDARMTAVETARAGAELTENDARALAREFGAGEVSALRRVAAGTINANYALSTASGAYFLRVNEGKGEDEVRWEAELVWALERAGVPVVAPLPAARGEPFARWGSALVSLFPWRPGEHRGRGEVSEGDARALGLALAHLHEAGLPLAPRFERRGIYTFEDIVRRFERIRERRDPALDPAVEAIAEEIPWLRQREAVRAAAPTGVIHGDLFRDNVLFRGRELEALLDFEQASTGSLAYDLAVCINAWCWDEDVEIELARALVSGYRAGRGLEDASRQALYPELRAAAMRFTVTRITDVYLRGADNPEKDFRRYLRRLERWRELGPEVVEGDLAPA